MKVKFEVRCDTASIEHAVLSGVYCEHYQMRRANLIAVVAGKACCEPCIEKEVLERAAKVAPGEEIEITFPPVTESLIGL